MEEKEVLFFYFVPDTTRDLINIYTYIGLFFCEYHHTIHNIQTQYKQTYSCTQLFVLYWTRDLLRNKQVFGSLRQSVIIFMFMLRSTRLARLSRQIDARTPAVSVLRSAIAKVKQRWSLDEWPNYLEFLCASAGTLSQSRLHLQSLAPTNPHWARVVG
jgi:hypothetical protein